MVPRTDAGPRPLPAGTVGEILEAGERLEFERQLQWLRRPGYPEVTARWAYDSSAHEVIVDVAQGGRFGPFEFPLTIAAVDSAGALPT